MSGAMPLLCTDGKGKAKQLSDLEPRQTPEDINVTKSMKGLCGSIKIETVNVVLKKTKKVKHNLIGAIQGKRA